MRANPFRRFTWFFYAESEPIQAFLQGVAWQAALKQISTHQIFDFRLYHKEHGYFLLVDTDPGLNSTSLLEVLKGEMAFKMLNKTLTAKRFAPRWNKPLERIYKLEQKVAYSPTEGQLKTDIGAYKRFVWTLLLAEDPELIVAYKRAHSIGMAWPEITHNMKAIGVKDMEIYLHENQAILIMDTQPDFDLEIMGPKWQQLPREREWQAYVAKFQRTDRKSAIQEKWQDMKDISLT